MKPLLLFSLLLLVVPATGQEHAPTAAQCQADAAVWGDGQLFLAYWAALDSGAPNNTYINKLAARELDARIKEMSACRKVDPDRVSGYADTLDLYNLALHARLNSFMSRHNLWDQFLSEDDEGKR